MYYTSYEIGTPHEQILHESLLGSFASRYQAQNQ